MTEFEARKTLDTPLEFGNVDQIKALKVLYPPEVDAEGRKRYRVDIEVNYHETVYVYAENEHAARTQAKDDFDSSDFELEITVQAVGEQ